MADFDSSDIQNEAQQNSNRKTRTSIDRSILKAIRKGIEREFPDKKIAEDVNLSISAVRNYIDKMKKNLSDEEILSAKKGRPLSLGNNISAILATELERDCSFTQTALAEKLRDYGIVTAQCNISRTLQKMEYTRKRLTRVPIERNSDRILSTRQEYARVITNLNNENLVFLDESGFNSHLVPHYGYSPKNSKAYVTVPANKGQNISLMCAINSRKIIS